MATIDSREIIDRIIANKGYYDDPSLPGNQGPDNARVVLIVEYRNMFNKALSYGVTFENERIDLWDRYLNSPNCLEPDIIWDIRDEYTASPKSR